MADLPTIKSIRLEDLGSQAPTWMVNLLSPLNEFIESVYTALNKQITLVDNVRASYRTVTFRTESDYEHPKHNFIPLKFSSGIAGKARAVLIAQAYPRDNSSALIPSSNATGELSCQWIDVNGEINILYISGLENSVYYTITFLVL
jgi:hypothetical protein